ncbi:hypothetical protein L596_012303 [Steinernema carpocapsae]|uniref:Uncharacterized protein n=2 Tax=Steinernema carpocapsae TaxID=34508 RepID=A0A4U5NXA6_STECR|nr:hypothetical protein L596_012303 [Steinernema carpocapsae]
MFFGKADADLLMRNLGLKPSVSVEDAEEMTPGEFGSPKTTFGIPIKSRSFQNSCESLSGGSLKSSRSRPFSPLPQIDKIPPHHGHFQEAFRSRAMTMSPSPMYPLQPASSTDMFLHRLDERNRKLFYGDKTSDEEDEINLSMDRLKLGQRVMSLEFPPLKATPTSSFSLGERGGHAHFCVKSQTLTRRPQAFEVSFGRF